MKNGFLVLFAAMLFLASCDYKYDYKLPDYSGYIRPSIYYYVDISSAMDSVIDADLDSAGIDPGPVARSYLLEIVEKDSQGDSLQTQYLNSWDLQTQSNHLNSTPGTAGIEVALIVPGIDADDHTFPVYKYTFSFALEPENPDSLFQNNFVLSPSMPYVRTKYPLDVSGLSSAYYVENRMDEVIYSDFAGEGLRYNSQGGSGYDVALTERDGTGKVLRQDTLSGWSVSMDHTVVKSAAGTTDVELSLIAKSTDAAGHSFPVFKYTFSPQPVSPGKTTVVVLSSSGHYDRKRL